MTSSATVPPPATVFVPVSGPPARDGSVQVVLRACEGSLVLPAYSTLELLLVGCGRHQPWAVLRSDDVEALLPSWGDAVAVLDVDVTPFERQQAAGP